MNASAQPVDARTLSRLKWRCRRGLLENDLLIERFFARYETTLTADDAAGIAALMELADNDLLELLLARREPRDGELAEEALRVLGRMRPPQAPKMQERWAPGPHIGGDDRSC